MAKSTITESLNVLVEQGWARSTRPISTQETWPPSGQFILEKGDEVLLHTYWMGEDMNDYRGRGRVPRDLAQVSRRLR